MQRFRDQLADSGLVANGVARRLAGFPLSSTLPQLLLRPGHQNSTVQDLDPTDTIDAERSSFTYIAGSFCIDL